VSITRTELLKTMKQRLLPEDCTFSARQLVQAAEPLIELAVREDIPDAEMIDARMIIDRKLASKANILTNQEGKLAGGWVVMQVAARFSKAVDAEVLVRDGSDLRPGQRIATIEGSAAVIVTMERTLLNFLSRLSGIATLTGKCVQAAAAGDAVITDTRKTMPGYRLLDKYAVQCGGGQNHRMGLCDGVMIKDNHITAMNEVEITHLVRRARQALKRRNSTAPIWVEVDRLDQLQEALVSGADVILLDNMSVSQLRAAVQMRNELYRRAHPTEAGPPRPLLEASGGIDLSNIADVASTGVDRIAVGALTHSAPALDLTLELES